mmetsp:Transcript_17900/g.36799  ORF Transcript_17900/g.36799 Transcript_17900/m.36799 type:complete len:212 (+) Transcript_17900:388-1023(+)
MTVRRKRIVSKVLERRLFSESTVWVTRPMVEAPQDITWSSCNLKKRLPEGTAVDGSDQGACHVFPSKASLMAMKKGEQRKSCAVASTSSQSPSCSAARDLASSSSRACSSATIRLMSASFSALYWSIPYTLGVKSSCPRSVLQPMRRSSNFSSSAVAFVADAAAATWTRALGLRRAKHLPLPLALVVALALLALPTRCGAITTILSGKHNN